MDVAWLYACQDDTKRVDWNDHLLDKTLVKEKAKDSSDEGINPDYEEVPEHGWTDAVDYGCSCVCHENLDDACPWCQDCSINRAKARKTNDEEESVKSVAVKVSKAEEFKQETKTDLVKEEDASADAKSDVESSKRKKKKRKKEKKTKKERAKP